jgi:hypothetical protein
MAKKEEEEEEERKRRRNVNIQSLKSIVMAWGHGSSVECLPSMCMALSSNPSDGTCL